MASWRNYSWSGSSSSSSSSRRQDWTCKLCQCENWAEHKVCWQCKAQRQFAEAHSDDSVPSQTWSSPSPSPRAASPSPSERQVFAQRLKRAEAVLAQMPADDEWYASERTRYVQMIAELKKQIIGTKSVGQQIDGCKGALERAQKRHAAALENIAAAEKNRDNAAEEISRLQHELSELEAAVSSQLAQEAESTSVSHMQSVLTRVISEMCGSGNVAPQELDAATSLARSLSSMISEIQGKAKMRVALSHGAQSDTSQMSPPHPVIQHGSPSILTQLGAVHPSAVPLLPPAQLRAEGVDVSMSEEGALVQAAGFHPAAPAIVQQ